MKIRCEGKDHNSDGTVLVEVVNSDTVKGKVQFATNSKGRNMNMDMSFTGRYLGSDCGEVRLETSFEYASNFRCQGLPSRRSR